MKNVAQEQGMVCQSVPLPALFLKTVNIETLVNIVFAKARTVQ